MKTEMTVLNMQDSPVEVEGFTFLPGKEITISVDLTSMSFQHIRTTRGLKIGKPWQMPEREVPPLYRTTVLNTLHFPVTVEGYTFPPGEEIALEIEVHSMAFRNIRSTKGLRVGKLNNDFWLSKHWPRELHLYNMVYDAYSEHRSSAYIHAIEALARPIISYLPPQEAGFVDQPAPGLNLRFFSAARIRELGKRPVGPHDIFMSHGVADKNYWLADRIRAFRHVLVPGPAWKERIEAGGYEGQIHVVGYTKLDPLFRGEYTRIQREKPYVVWAPTHGYRGKHRGRSSYPWCMELVREIPSCYETAVALHPASRLSRQQRQNVTFQELLDADVVIADAGSTLYEAWALGKPVIFPDWLCKDDVLDHFKDDPGNLEYQIYDEEIGYHAKSMAHLIELIEVALRDGMKQREIDFIEGVFPSNLRGNAGKAAAAALMKIQKEG